MSEKTATVNLPMVEDFSQVFPGSSSSSSKGRARRNISATRIIQAIDELVFPTFSSHTVLANVGQPYKLEAKLDGRVYRTSEIRGDVAVVSAGIPIEARSREQEQQKVESFVMHLDPVFVCGVAEGVGVDADRLELIGILNGREAVRTGERDRGAERLRRLRAERRPGSLRPLPPKGEIYQSSRLLWGGVYREYEGLGDFLGKLTGIVESRVDTERYIDDEEGHVVASDTHGVGYGPPGENSTCPRRTSGR